MRAVSVYCAAVALGISAQNLAAAALLESSAKPGQFVTNAVQFRSLSGAEYLLGCDFRLTGVITLVDTNRALVVLQDSSGAVALHFAHGGPLLQAGQLVTLEGSHCAPYFAPFPDYPHRPAGRDIRTSFEAPMSWGDYYLTRMRGFLRPPVSGNYTFWIASDNSSELWLSPDADPSKRRKMASVSRFAWVDPGEWSKFPSQQAEPVFLRAGESYYIEALQEQSVGGDHLSVAWEGPSISRSIIAGLYMVPWREPDSPFAEATNGILREYWTNYCAADLKGMAGVGLGSTLTVKRVTAHIHGPGQFPIPLQITLGEQWPADNNFRWVEAEGIVRFVGTVGDLAVLEVSDGRALVQVRAYHWNAEMSRRVANAAVRIEGVCEGVYDQKGTLTPGLIWASAVNGVSFIETLTHDSGASVSGETGLSNGADTQTMRGFYGTRGVVTFSDRAFDKDLVFIQEDNAAMFIALGNHPFRNQLKVGQGVDLGGLLEPGKSVPVITPFYVTELGWRALPVPFSRPLSLPSSENRDGRWSEFEGVVRSVKPDSTLSIALRDGSAYLWLGQCDSNDAARFVDSRLRARGVLSLTTLEAPVLFVPSREFVQVEEAPADPPDYAGQPISNVLSSGTESWRSHRVRVNGAITYRDRRSFFVQDESGGIRVQTPLADGLDVGDTVEVIAFPNSSGFACNLSDALVYRPAPKAQIRPKPRIAPQDLDLAEALSPLKRGTLVQVNATVLESRTNESNHVLELQESRRVFYASLAVHQGNVPDIAPGSRVRVIGVLDEEVTGASLNSASSRGERVLSALNILLRGPQDVKLLSGPPWWTLKRTAALVGTLLTILVVSLLWVHLLRRRLERQHAAQFAFSRRVLERVEDERRRIAANLHDSLGQTLLVIKNHAIMAAQSPPQGELQHRLSQISGTTSQAIEEIRQITHELRPYQLDRLGLTQAIRASISRASENSSILFASRVEHIDGIFDKDAEINVYRIVQEAVTNVVKHSGATEAAVVIKRRKASVSISIRDNGCGFDPTETSSGAHDLGYGLSGIKERTRILRGTVTIDSRPGEGTSLAVEVPLPGS